MQQAAPRVTRLAELLQAREIGDAFRRARAPSSSGDEVRLAAARARSRRRCSARRLPEGAREPRARPDRRGEALAARARVPASDALLAPRRRRDARPRLARRGARHGQATALAAVRADYLDTYQARLRGALEAADEALERGFSFAPRGRERARPRLLRHPRAVLPAAARRRSDRSARADFDGLVAAALARRRGRLLAGPRGGRARARGFPGRAARAGGGDPARGPVPPLPRARPGRVRPRRRRRTGDARRSRSRKRSRSATEPRRRSPTSRACSPSATPAAVRRDRRARRRASASDLAAAAQGGAVAAEEPVEAKANEALDVPRGSSRRSGRTPEPPPTSTSSAPRSTGSSAPSRRRVRQGRAGAARGLRVLRVRPRAAAARARARPLRPHRGPLLVRRRRASRARAADPAQGSPEEVTATREALDSALADSEAAVGAGPTSAAAVVTNTAIIVFREGLEAVLILAALTAGLVGRRSGACAGRSSSAPRAALLASVVTFVVAKTLLSSLVRYGEKLEAIVSLVAIAVLLLDPQLVLPPRLLERPPRRAARTQEAASSRAPGSPSPPPSSLGLATLGFTAVYREGFETVLFLQALVLEAGAASVVEGRRARRASASPPSACSRSPCSESSRTGACSSSPAS